MVVTDTGASYAWGTNKHGQLGVGSIARTKPKEDDVRMAPVVCAVSGATAVACGRAWQKLLRTSLNTCANPRFLS